MTLILLIAQLGCADLAYTCNLDQSACWYECREDQKQPDECWNRDSIDPGDDVDEADICEQ